MNEHHLLQAALEVGETVTDAMTDNEIVKSMPVVGIAVKFLKGRDDIRDRMFAAKLRKFLLTIDKVSPDDREKMKRRVASSPDEAKHVGETLLLVIDRITALEKAEILA